MSKSFGCNSASHFQRRTLLKAAGLSGLAWLTPVAQLLGRAEEAAPQGTKAKSVILLWLQGGPSQLETFDPHPGQLIGGETRAIKTAARDVRIASSLERTADVMDSIAVLRNVVSKEGDHERATYTVKSGYRPDPTLVHPSIGAIVCHELPVGQAEIPRHISILPNQWAGRGGYLGDQFDSFRVPDPLQPLPDVKPRVDDKRFAKRLSDLSVIEQSFARGRLSQLDAKTQHQTLIAAAQKMMTSDQLKAFDVTKETKELRDDFGDTPFGRSCLAAARLVECGVRCVEVTLDGWDTHINNHEQTLAAVKQLDPALAALIKELQRRDLYDSTIVIVGGEFGRTPTINPAGGRDHWPHGFSLALAGGGLRTGIAVGETSPAGDKLNYDDDKQIKIANVHATILSALGIDYAQYIDTPIGRPMQLCEGKPVKELLRS